MEITIMKFITFAAIILVIIIIPIIQIMKLRKFQMFEKDVKRLLGDKYLIYYNKVILRDFFDFGESPLSAAQEMIASGRCRLSTKS